MPRLICWPSARIWIDSVTIRSPLRCTSTSLMKRSMRSSAKTCVRAAAKTSAASSIRLRFISRTRQFDRRNRGIVRLEKMLFVKSGNAGQQQIGKRLDTDVVVANGSVVVAARHLQLIFQFGKLPLQFEKILAGLE